MRGMLGRLARTLWMVRVLVRAGMVPLVRPDRYVRMVAVVLRGVTATTGIALAAARAPRRTALVDERGSLTWAELDAGCDAFAVGLLALTGGEPRTVAVLARNHRGFVHGLAGATRAGSDVLLLNTAFSGPQLRDVLVREQAAMVVYDQEFQGVVDQACAGLDVAEVVAWVEDPATLGERTVLDDLVAHHAGARPGRPARRGSVILLTSGTTGTPKGAKRSADGGAPALAAMFERIPWRAEEPVVVAAPMFHAWGFGQLAIAAATTCTIITRRRFDPEATLRMVEEHGATGLAVVPVMLERIIDLPDEVLDRYPCRTLRFATASGSRMRPEAVTAFMDRFGEVVCNSYNATEAGLISTATPADLRVAPDTAGRPVRGTDVVLFDDAGRPVPTGEVGRICVRSGSQFSGYTSGTTKEFHQDHMVSGDVGRFDADGRLFVVGRDDDMIVSGGENVYPLEVEKLLDAHPQVHETAVVGVDDEAFGQRLAAYVVLRPGAELDADGVRAHVKANLAGYKVPRDVVLLDELPRNATGKVMKRLLPTPGGAADLPGS
ncbi:AMP-binding protein [Nocardioides sp.]|uniref:AMP-binding protein n=1 Tax=Nocardioides sp. TaxID=35761 RepID=UPI0026327B35|nr:AMP-binding protein [Nocardioides sp.]